MQSPKYEDILTSLIFFLFCELFAKFLLQDSTSDIQSFVTFLETKIVLAGTT